MSNENKFSGIKTGGIMQKNINFYNVNLLSSLFHGLLALMKISKLLLKTPAGLPAFIKKPIKRFMQTYIDIVQN